MTTRTGAAANNPTVVTGSTDDDMRAMFAVMAAAQRGALTPDKLAAETAARADALARNRQIILDDLARQRARRAELVAVWDSKIAETERMLAALEHQGA